MPQNNGQLDGGQFLVELAHRDAISAQFFQRIITAVNKLGSNLAANVSGNIAPPPPVTSLQVKTGGEFMHVALSHPGQIQRGVQYFTEVSANDPNFSQPIVIDHGASRTSHPFPLATNDDNGAPINYFVRSYAQYHGSKRSDFAYWGSKGNPTAVNMSGTTNMTPLASTGSGTGSNTGQQGGVGLGHFLTRPASGPKRNV